MQFKPVHVFIFILLSGICRAQDPYYMMIDKTKGLPSNAVYDMYQDSKGFMWLATDEGLCRYDGKNFKTYTSPILTSRSGTCINEDKFGRIWYSNFDNRVYCIENNELKGVEQNPTNGLFLKYHLMGDYIFIPQKKGIDVFTLKDLKFKQTFISPDIVYSVGNGNRFYFQDEFMNIYQIDSALEMIRIARSEQVIIGANNEKVALCEKVGPQENFEIYNGETLEKFNLKINEYINNICFTDKYIWICTKNGIYKNDSKLKGKYEHHFAGKYISCVIKDKNDNYWISTTSEGIMFIPSLENCFYKFENFIPQQLQVVRNKLLIGGKNNEIIEFTPGSGELGSAFKVDRNHEISCFYYDTTKDELLVSSDVFYIQKKGKILLQSGMAIKSICKIDDKYYSTSATGVSGLVKDRAIDKPSIWDSLHSANQNTVANLSGLMFSNLIIQSRGKSTVYDEQNKRIYYATNDGLYQVNPVEIIEIRYNEKKIQARKLIFYNGFLLALQNNGIILAIDKTKKISEYPLIIDGHIVAVNRIIGRKNWLFMCTNGEGVYKLNMNDPIRTFRSIDEINKNEDVVDIEVLNNKYLISCSGGLLVLNEKGKTIEKKSPDFIIQEVKTDGKTVDHEKKMWFPYYRNNIEIAYSILSFNSNLNYPLYYRINNGEWKSTNPESRELELASLKSDHYTIEFKVGKSEDAAITTLKFVIGKPIWQIHWFWIALLIIVVIIAFILYKWRINALSKRNKLLLEKVELEKNLNKSMLTSIKAQMNPHFFYNALNTIQSFIFADDKKNAATYLAKFSKLTRLILEMSEKETILLSEEIQALQLYLEIEKVRFNNKLSFSVNYPGDLDVEMIKIPPMLIQPYVENAIKHGLMHKKENCKLLINFDQIADMLMITIDDNGIGRNKSQELQHIKESRHKSFATDANQKRLDILNTGRKSVGVKFIDKQDESGNPAGTTVIISLPLNK